MKRRILTLAVCLLILGSLTLTVFARDLPDLERKGSITVTMTYEDKPVSGGRLTIYRVGYPTVDDAYNYSFVYTDRFAKCEVPIDDPSTAKVAQALAAMVRRNALSGTRKVINKQGTVTFDDLESGLYLLIQPTPAIGYNTVSPFLVSVPQFQEDGRYYVYDVDASPKVELEPKETTKPTESTTPKGDKIPQTGQVNWPVPILAVGGLFLLILGKCLRTSERKKRYEE